MKGPCRSDSLSRRHSGLTVNRGTLAYWPTHTENFAENYIGSARRGNFRRQLHRSDQRFRGNRSSLVAFLPLWQRHRGDAPQNCHAPACVYPWLNRPAAQAIGSDRRVGRCHATSLGRPSQALAFFRSLKTVRSWACWSVRSWYMRTIP